MHYDWSFEVAGAVQIIESLPVSLNADCSFFF
jgi:hypothetical protein